MSKNKIAGLVLFYIVNATWGFIMTFIGVLVALCLLILGYKPKVYHHVLYFEVMPFDGMEFGSEFGCIFIATPGCGDRLKKHECGHAVQNFMFGPGMIFISLASLIRFWVRAIQAKEGKDLKPYDSIWFEGQATKLGLKYFA